MNVKQARWGRRYAVAMCQHLTRIRAGDLHQATVLGDQAVALGLETLDVAKFHEQVLMDRVRSGESPEKDKKLIKKASRFFAETIVPIEKTHVAARQNDFRVNELTRTLRRRTVESSASTLSLEQGVERRRAAETALRKSGKYRVRLMQESARLREKLRDQARGMLSAQEDERRKISRELHNELAQTLLAIKLRLLMLNKSTRSKRDSLKKEIAETQQLVKDSVNRTRRVAHEFVNQHKA